MGASSADRLPALQSSSAVQLGWALHIELVQAVPSPLAAYLTALLALGNTVNEAPASGSDRGASPRPLSPPLQEVAAQDAALARRERELNQREQELRRMETEMRNRGGGASNKNWPKFCPIVHHDIAGEVPAQMQGMVRCGYWSFLVSCSSRCRPAQCTLGRPLGSSRSWASAVHLGWSP
jgi:hypothetical protein